MTSNWTRLGYAIGILYSIIYISWWTIKDLPEFVALNGFVTGLLIMSVAWLYNRDLELTKKYEGLYYQHKEDVDRLIEAR